MTLWRLYATASRAFERVGYACLGLSKRATARAMNDLAQRPSVTPTPGAAGKRFVSEHDALNQPSHFST